MKSLSLLLALAVATPMAADCPSVSWLEQSSADAAGLPFINNIVAVDFDHDGNDDIVYHEGQSGNGTLFRARSTGNHSFEPPVTLATEMSTPLEAGDINGDGWTDVVTTTIGGSMVVFPGSASGFGSPWFPGPGVRTFDLGNFDGDPQLEIVTAGDGIVAYWDFSGGTFVKQAQRTDSSSTMIRVAGGDFDGDGRTDIALAAWNPMALKVYFRNADATFTAPRVLTTGAQPMEIAAGDLNGDGKAEIALGDWQESNIRIYRPAPSRQFTVSAPLLLKKPNQVPFGGGMRLRDISGDGQLDLLGSTPNGWWLTAWINAGDGTFLSPSFTDNAGPMAYAIGDFDGDDTLDIYSATFEGRHFFSAACATQVYAFPRAPLVSAADPAVLNAVISGFPAAPPPDRGNVTFREGSTVLGVASVDATGAAALSVAGLAVGEHTIDADFSGNAAVPAGLSLPFVQTVTSDVTTLTLTTPEESPIHRVPWPVTIEVEGDTQATVDVFVDGVLQRHHLPNNPLNLVLNAGAHTIRVFYQGTPFLPAAEEELSVTALKATAEMEISGERSVRTGTAHALQFTLSGPEGAPVPTGTVTLTENGVTRGSGSLVNGVATINVTFPLGAHDVRATYGGNAGYQSKFTDLTLHVLPNFPVSIAARGIPGSIHIAYVLWPDVDPESLKLFRRVNGTTEWSWLSSWSRNDGRDLTAAAGTAYEYRLDAQLTGGTPINSNMDTAIRFNDDPLTVGLKIRQLHFNEIRTAVNLLRAQASLSPFNFEAGFSTNKIIRASHINGLRTAVNEARTALGMSTFSFATISAGTKVNAADVLQVRDAAR